MVDQEPGVNQNTKRFISIEKTDTGILYALELTSSISVLLLAFWLIASMANVLTKGSVLTDNLFMQRVWAWTQCIAIDASIVFVNALQFKVKLLAGRSASRSTPASSAHRSHPTSVCPSLGKRRTGL